MTTRKKNQPQHQNETDSLSLETLSTNDSGEPVEVETDVQNHKVNQPSLIERAKRKMKDLASDDEYPQEKKSKGAPGYIRPQQREELATLVSSVFVMLIAGLNVPDELAPETYEINGVSNHLIKILARHVDLSKSLTGDVLDIIGIVAICSGWYARVAPVLSEMRKEKEKKKSIKKIFSGENTVPPQQTDDPKEAVSSFLNSAALSGGE